MKAYVDIRNRSLEISVKGYAVCIYAREIHRGIAAVLLSVAGFYDQFQRGLTNLLKRVTPLFDKIKSEADMFAAEIEKYLAEAHLPGYLSIIPEDKRLLYIITRAYRPSIVIETGVGLGISTILILRALSMNQQGKLFYRHKGAQWTLPKVDQ